jgi:[acyl-carrier-protein] S-malonyltransferase/trans-AT polyketide synthase/acyltransferase/oxidoreductase domain-containing protein
MGRDFFDACAESRAVYEEASDAIGYDVAALSFDDAERLALTEFQQPAILATEIAMLASLRAQYGWAPRFFGGHSLGEYTALVAAGVLHLADAIRIVALRGRLMQQAVPAGEGAMTAIIQTDLDVDWLCDAASAFEVDVANHNALDQAALSGLAANVAAAVAAVKTDPVRRVRAIPLRVSAPFHSRHMKSVEAPLLDALHDVGHVAGREAVRVLSNTSGAFHTGSRTHLEDSLAAQVSNTVRWVDCMRALLDRDCEIVEVGPGKPLRGFFGSLGVEIRSVTSLATAERAAS